MSKEISPDSIAGRVLLALRAGVMEGFQLYERFGSNAGTGISFLTKKGLIESVDSATYGITEAGRNACPTRRRHPAMMEAPQKRREIKSVPSPAPEPENASGAAQTVQEKPIMTQSAPQQPTEGRVSTQQQVYDFIRKEPGITQEEVVGRFAKDKRAAARTALWNLKKTKRIEEETAGNVTRLRINLRVGDNKKVRGAPAGKLVTGNDNPTTPATRKDSGESTPETPSLTAAPHPAPFMEDFSEFRCTLWSDGTLVMEIPGHGRVELPPFLSAKLRDYVSHVDLAVEG